MAKKRRIQVLPKGYWVGVKAAEYTGYYPRILKEMNSNLIWTSNLDVGSILLITLAFIISLKIFV